MTDYKALCARTADELDHYRQLLMDDRREVHALATEARAALAEPEPERPTVMQIIALADEIEKAELGQVDLVRAALARWGNHPGSPDSSTDLESRIEDLEALVHQLRVGYLRMGNAVVKQLPDPAKFFSDITSDSDD